MILYGEMYSIPYPALSLILLKLGLPLLLQHEENLGGEKVLL